MFQYAIKRVLLSIPTLLLISLVLFTILAAAPGDPTGNLPLTIPAEVREQVRDNLGLNDPFFFRWLKWVRAMFINEPLYAFESLTNTCVGECTTESERVLSWSSRSPALDTIYQRLPQTMWVLGLALLFGTIVAIPIGIYSAYRQYSVFDNVGSVVSLIGFAMPVYWTGLLLIFAFSVKLGWFPSFYDTTHDVEFTNWESIKFQARQLAMPVGILTLFNAATISRFTRAAVLDNLNQDYVRTARAKGLREAVVVNLHVMRNSMIPVITLIALSAAAIFNGAILTETVFRINGLGQLLVVAIGQGDFPMLQTLVFFFALMTVVFNLVADILYGLFDPRIRYD